MYVAEGPNRGAKPTVLLRESYREDGKVKSRTLANLTHLPPHILDAVRRAAKNETLVNAVDAFHIERSRHHGHVDAVLSAMRRLGMDKLIACEPSRERDLVLGMIAARILEPKSKMETTRWWHNTTLPTTLGVSDADEDELYDAMDWVLKRQERIEEKLARRHLKPAGLVLYDLTSTYMEGTHCPLAKRGYNRDKKPDKLQVNFGMLTDDEGCPVAVHVYEGNVADPKTVPDQVRALRKRFNIDLVIFVGDRGMITEAHIDSFKETHTSDAGVEWVTALKSGAIRKLKAEGSLQLGLFDEKNLFTFSSPDYPGERLVACRNPELQKHRARKRQELIAATKRELEKVQEMVRGGRLSGKAEIGLRVGRVINKYKVAKHFKIEIEASSLHYRVRPERVAAEAALDGIYVVRTSVPSEVMESADVVRCYKRLTRVERAFRSMKTVDLRVRPIYHRLSDRVRAHIFVCMLAYYVEWHLRRAWASLLFDDEVDTSWMRDAVAKAEPSTSAKEKARTKLTADGLPVNSFQSLLASLSSVVKNECRREGASVSEPHFEMTTRPDAVQARARQLVETVPLL
jgi:transposase